MTTTLNMKTSCLKSYGKLHRIAVLSFVCSLFMSMADAGVGCFAACAIACCEAGVLSFAGPLGIAVTYTGCAGVCMVACATAAFIPPACFRKDTMLQVVIDGNTVGTLISQVKVNDSVLTLIDNVPIVTKVVRNEKSQGDFEFFEFQTVSLIDDNIHSTLSVTPNHGMLLVSDDGNLEFAQSSDLQIGAVILTKGGATCDRSHPSRAFR